MPSAEKKNSMDKQAGMENVEPIKQAQIIVEHKIRNIEKRKRKIENYKDDQAKGQTLNADQLLAVSKYDEVCKTLVFAQELIKQFSSIALESAKQQKKQARKEALERATIEVTKVKEILLVQDVLKTMGVESVREDFLAGQNKAIVLTEEELQYLDDFYVEVSPERMAEDDEGYMPFDDQAQSAAEHLIALVEARPKDVAGTTYSNLKELIGKIQACGYLEARARATPDEPAQEATEGTEAAYSGPNEVAATEPISVLNNEEYYEESGEVPEAQEIPQEIIQTELTTEPTIQATPPVIHRTVSELIDPVTSPFNFLQDSELEADVTPPPPPPVAPAPGLAQVGPIPTQMYINQSFVAAPVYGAPAGTYVPAPGPAAGGASNPPPPIPMPPSHRTASPFQQGQPFVQEQPYQQQQPPQQQQAVPEFKPPETQEQVQPQQQPAVAVQPAVAATTDHGGDWALETEDTGATGDWIQPPNSRSSGSYAARNSRPSNYQNNRGGGGYNSYSRNDNSYKNGYGGQREGGYGGQRDGNYGGGNYGGGGRPRGGQRGGQYGGGRGNRGYGGGGYMGQQRQSNRQ